MGHVGGEPPGLLLTFWMVTRRVSGCSGSLSKHVFVKKRRENRKCVSFSNNAISHPLERKKMLVFLKCLKLHVFSQFLFHRNGYFETTHVHGIDLAFLP